MKRILAISSVILLSACSEKPNTPPPYEEPNYDPQVIMEVVRDWCENHPNTSDIKLCACAQDITKLPQDCDWEIDPYSIPKL
jgi:hypothetical protein